MIQKLSDVLHSKKFWTLVAAIVAALSAYFCTACSASYRTTQTYFDSKTGDSVRMTYENFGRWSRGR